MREKMKGLISKWFFRPKEDLDRKSIDASHANEDAALHAPLSRDNRTSADHDNWKQRALNDFQNWLDDLPDTQPAAEDPDMDACDLYTLLSEFSALRQEIRMQNREQHRGIGALETLTGEFHKTVKTAGEIRDDHRRAVETVDLLARELKTAADQMRRHVDAEIKREAEKRTVLPFLDIRDALIRGRQAACDIGSARGFFRRPPKEIASVVEGYDMAVRRFDRALAAVGIHPVDARGKPFDPATMRAVDTCSRPDMEKGHVAAEPLSGFVRGDEVIRTAEVVVNQ